MMKGLGEGGLDEKRHLAGDPRTEIVGQLEGVLDGEARRVPHFLEL